MHAINIRVSLVTKRNKTPATLNVASSGNSIRNVSSCTSLVHETPRATTIPCIIFRLVLLHIVSKLALVPVECLIDNERIKIPIALRLLEDSTNRRPNLEWRLKRRVASHKRTQMAWQANAAQSVVGSSTPSITVHLKHFPRLIDNDGIQIPSTFRLQNVAPSAIPVEKTNPLPGKGGGFVKSQIKNFAVSHETKTTSKETSNNAPNVHEVFNCLQCQLLKTARELLRATSTNRWQRGNQYLSHPERSTSFM